MKVQLYDTTLRDGTQSHGLSLTVEDKLKIARALDGFGVPYIECGWPGSNPKDKAFFQRARELTLKQARLVAFGSTRRVGQAAEDDQNLTELLAADTPAVALVGKTWSLHVSHVLGTTREENLSLIRDSVALMKRHGREVIYDAEHFFDGYADDPDYALATLTAAAEAGADWLVLCDTNGGSLPSRVARVVSEVAGCLHVPLGVHTHNDAELAVANALSAVEAGCSMVQGVINGYGERCGNANLISLIPTLQLKMGHDCVPEQNLVGLTELSRHIDEVANLAPNPYAPYVGRSAFAHKGGIHVAAVARLAESYEHLDPGVVGNRRHFVVSELAGRRNISTRAAQLGLDLEGRERQILEKVKELEHQGYEFAYADGGFELLVRRDREGYQAPFRVLDTFVVSEKRGEHTTAEATVKLRVEQETAHTVAEGEGPVQALDRALRKALLPHFPHLERVRLVDYKVRILDPGEATGATTRVLVEAAAGDQRWACVGCSVNIIEASAQALTDSLELFLLRHQEMLSPAAAGGTSA